MRSCSGLLRTQANSMYMKCRFNVALLKLLVGAPHWLRQQGPPPLSVSDAPTRESRRSTIFTSPMLNKFRGSLAVHCYHAHEQQNKSNLPHAPSQCLVNNGIANIHQLKYSLARCTALRCCFLSFPFDVRFSDDDVCCTCSSLNLASDRRE